MNLFKSQFDNCKFRYAVLLENLDYGEGNTIHEALVNAAGIEMANYITGICEDNNCMTNFRIDHTYNCETALMLDSCNNTMATIYRKL